MSTIVTTTLSSGMTLVVEPLENVASVAAQWLLPSGSATDPVDGDGYATLLCELIFRGAGDRSSREHSDALDCCGVQRAASVGAHHLRLGATLMGDRLDEALPLLADMVRRASLPAEALEPVRRLCLQSLESLDDDPQHLVMIRLREQHLPPPFNRHGYGDADVLRDAAIEPIRRAFAARFVPEGSILAVAGAVDAAALAARLEDLLGGWSGAATEAATSGPPARGHRHIEQETAQVHIGVAWDAPPESDDDAMLERLGTGVLSGGTSGRLFTEVRQKRSLCYSVGASYRAGRDRGHVSMYAGTTPERAQQTLDVAVEQVRRLADGVRADEFDRAVTGLKSRLIMQGESTAARAATIAADQFRLGRPRTLGDVAAQIDAITLDRLNAYLAAREIGDLTITSIGPAPLEAPNAAAVATT
jgi:predicted Zn-dependent peptidase